MTPIIAPLASAFAAPLLAVPTPAWALQLPLGVLGGIAVVAMAVIAARAAVADDMQPRTQLRVVTAPRAVRHAA